MGWAFARSALRPLFPLPKLTSAAHKADMQVRRGADYLSGCQPFPVRSAFGDLGGELAAFEESGFFGFFSGGRLDPGVGLSAVSAVDRTPAAETDSSRVITVAGFVPSAGGWSAIGRGDADDGEGWLSSPRPG